MGKIAESSSRDEAPKRGGFCLLQRSYRFDGAFLPKCVRAPRGLAAGSKMRFPLSHAAAVHERGTIDHSLSTQRRVLRAFRRRCRTTLDLAAATPIPVTA